MENEWCDFHDALVERLEIDIERRTIVIGMRAYRRREDKDRVPILLTFAGVQAFNTTADMLALADNAFAGHVNHAHLAEAAGTSHIYLVEGYLAVTADKSPRLSVAV